MSSKLLNTAEAAIFLRVSEASIRRWSNSGLLPSRRVGRRGERRFTESELTEFLRRDAPTASLSPPRPEVAINVGGAQVRNPSHLATYYSSEAGALRLTVPFLAEGLRLGQPCFLVATDSVLNAYLETLSKQADVDLNAGIDNGQFTVVRFEGVTADEAIAHWERVFASTLANGATAIRVVGEMASERRMFVSDDEMLRYEEALDVMFKRYPGAVICQYDVREFDGAAILRSIKAHPDLFGLRLGTFLH